MRFNKEVIVMTKAIENDGQGGRVEKLVEGKKIRCNITRLRRSKEAELFGDITNDSFNMISPEVINIDDVIKYNDKLYKIEGFLEGFRKYSYILRVDNNEN